MVNNKNYVYIIAYILQNFNLLLIFSIGGKIYIGFAFSPVCAQGGGKQEKFNKLKQNLCGIG